MGHNCPVPFVYEASRRRHNTSNFSYSQSGSSRIVLENIPVDNINVCMKIKHLLNFVLVLQILPARLFVDIVACRMLPINAKHQWFTRSIGFNAEGSVAVAVRLHLLIQKVLSLAYLILYLWNYIGAKGTTFWQEVDYSHCAGFANIQTCQPLGGRGGVIAPILLVIKGRAEMHAIG